MEVNKKRTFVIFLIVNLLILGISLAFYFMFIDSFAKNHIDKYLATTQNVVKDTTNEKIEEALNLFDDATSSFSVSELNEQITERCPLKEAGFLYFTENDNNKFIYEEFEVRIDKSFLKNHNFGFFNKYFYVFNEEAVGIVNFEQLIEEAISFTHANDLFVMSNQGEIYFNTNSEIYKNVLHEYLDVNTDDYIKNYFNVNKEVVIYSQINNNNVVVKFTPLKDFEDVYVAQQFYRSEIDLQYRSANLFLTVLFIIVSALNFGVLFLIFYLINKKNDDIENKKYEYYYDKPYVVKIDKKGFIKDLNLSVREDLRNTFVDAKNISEIFTDKDLAIDKIKRGSTIFLEEDGKTISFLPIRYRRGFYLIGEHIEGDLIGDSEVYNLAYQNQITGLSNIHLFMKDTNKSLLNMSIQKDETLYFLAFKIMGVEQSFSKISKVVIELALKEIGKELSSFIKDKDVSVYHLDLDEFVYVVKEDSFKNVENFVLKVIKHFEKPIIISKTKIDFRVSSAIVPVSAKDSSHMSAKDVYSQIGETLKRAVATDHQNYVLFDDTITHYLTTRQLMEKELEIAIENKDFIPFLQAQYDYKEDRITGFEALVRWDNPDYINKSPALFIELAEETGLINEIGKIMTEKTFEIAKKLEPYDVTISLNVSPVEILRQGFVEELLALQKKNKLKPGTITLEITETTLLDSYLIINEKIKILKRNSIKIDLDDFGTGYSSLPYIKDLDFDTIKIDKTFVDYIETDKYNKAIVGMIISLAKTLNADVIAEGVETKRQMDYLVKAGCNIIQGFYISKPLPYEEAKELLEEYNVKKTKSFKKRGRR